MVDKALLDVPSSAWFGGELVQASVLFAGRSPLPSWCLKLNNVINRWDSAHFLSIARDGYASIASHAFFPLLPLGIRTTAVMLSSSSSSSILVVAGLLISNVAFVWAVLALYELGCVVLKVGRGLLR